jgi:hypothetical protein
MSSSSTGSWFDAEALSLRETIEEFGEQFKLQPFRVMKVNYPTTPDLSRRPYTFWAVFERDAKDVSLGLENVNVSTRHLCVTGLVCDIPDAQQGDRLTHLLTGELFELTDVRPDGLSGVEMRMVQLGRAKQ